MLDPCQDMVESARIELNARLEKILRLWESEILAEFRMLYPDLKVQSVGIEIAERINFIIRLKYSVKIKIPDGYREFSTTVMPYTNSPYPGSDCLDVATLLAGEVDSIPVRTIVSRMARHFTGYQLDGTPPIKAERKWLT